jgi:hypothetical protein
MARSNRDPSALCQYWDERPFTTVDAQRYRLYLRGAGKSFFVLYLSKDLALCLLFFSGP